MHDVQVHPHAGNSALGAAGRNATVMSLVVLYGTRERVEIGWNWSIELRFNFPLDNRSYRIRSSRPISWPVPKEKNQKLESGEKTNNVINLN